MSIYLSIKRCLALTALVLLYSLSSNAQEAEVDGLHYRAVSDSEAELFNPDEGLVFDMDAEYGGSANTFATTVEVASSVRIDGRTYTVVGIGQSAFECRGDKYAFSDDLDDVASGYFEHPNDPDLVRVEIDRQKSVINKVVLPPTIRYIADRAFLGNVALTKINLPDALQSIGEQAFGQCHSLDGIILPDGLTQIGRMAFSCCYSLSEIAVPEGVEEVPEGAFDGCYALSKVTMGDGVAAIRKGAFWGCMSLTSVDIPNSVDSIGAKAFGRCTSLTSVRLPDMAHYAYSVTPAFDGCPIETIDGYGSSRPNGVYSLYALDGNCPYLRHNGSLFSVYAGRKATAQLEEWQKKGEFETTSQWRERVSEQGRRDKLESILDGLRQEYVKVYAPKSASFSIGSYDADNAVFPVKIQGGDMAAEAYASVPQADAPTFKEKWGTAVVTPTYGVVGDKIGVVDCSFAVGGKTYQSAKGYTAGESKEELAINIPPIDLGLGGGESGAKKAVKVDKTIDRNIPETPNDNTKTFAVIIGNENYSRVAKVDCARNDAKVFAAYCRNTLGLPAVNVRLTYDASYVSMMTALGDIKDIAESLGGDLRVIFYYAGHGVPDESDRNAFLLPVDADGSQTDYCLSLGKLYEELAALSARSVVVFLDACFSGSKRGEGMLTSARGIALKVKEAAPRGNMVVFSAATGDQTAYPYPEKGHGLFTFFLLQKIRDTKGSVTLGELGDYLTTQVNQHSTVNNRRKQTPTVTPASALAGSWRDLPLR